MNEKITVLLEKLYDYKTEEHKIFYPELKKDNLTTILMSIFGVVTIAFILDAFVFDWGYINFLIYFFAFFFLVAIPLSKKTDYKDEVLIFTTKGLIKRVAKKTFEFMEFDLITGFSHTEDSIILKRDEVEFSISIKKYQSSLGKLIDILEAKGKTFDKEKSYMVRPVTISIKDDQITIKDIKVALSNLEILSSKIAKNYPNVTPGFIEEIIPRNTSFDKVYYKGKDLYIECSHFEVRDGHPENIGFENMQVTDGIIVFTDFKVITFSKRDVNERSQKFVNLKTYKKTVEEELTKAVVSEWRFQRKSGELILASGVGALKIIFNFDDTLIGWKE